MVMWGQARGWTAATTVFVVLSAVTACTGQTVEPVPQSSYASPTAAPSATSPSQAGEPSNMRNDLAKPPLGRVLEAGPLTVNVEYTTPLAVKNWRANVSKPIRLTLTAVNKRKSGQKIYLSKTTVNVTAYDAEGVVDGPQTLGDTSNISPGYIVTFPDTYNQSFSLPPIDQSATSLVVDFTYELVLQASKDKDGRNFSKQVANDTFVVPING